MKQKYYQCFHKINQAFIPDTKVMLSQHSATKIRQLPWISSLPSDKTSFVKLVICPFNVESPSSHAIAIWFAELQSELALRWTITKRREFILLHIKTLSNIRTCQHNKQPTFTPHLRRRRDNEHVFIFERSIYGINHEDFQLHNHCNFTPTLISTT